MPVFSKSFFALVRGHFVAFSFLSAWHFSLVFLINILIFYFFFSVVFFAEFLI